MNYRVKQFIQIIILISLFIAGIDYATAGVHYPILLLTTDNKFGSFAGEILKIEGFNEFQIDSLAGAKVTLKYLKKFDVIILAEGSLTTDKKEMFARYVYDGGNLVAFRPDKKL